LKHDHLTEEGQTTAALYALGALCQHEARAFEIHLRGGCPACESELNEFEQVVGLIGVSAPDVNPPVYLRDMVVSRVEKEARASHKQFRRGAEVIPFPEHAPTGERAGQARASHRPRAGLRAAIPWAVAASLLVAFIYSVYSWQKDRREFQTSIDSLQASVASAEQELAQVNSSSRELAAINSVLAAEEHRVIALKGGAVAPSSSANVYWDVKNQQWVVSGDLPPAPAGKAYQLWFITPEAKISAAVMKSDQKGHVFGVVKVPSDVAGQIKAVAFTLEPESGSPQPTSDIYAVGNAG
jgi:Anti-sigma-K factor rskA